MARPWGLLAGMLASPPRQIFKSIGPTVSSIQLSTSWCSVTPSPVGASAHKSATIPSTRSSRCSNKPSQRTMRLNSVSPTRPQGKGGAEASHLGLISVNLKCGFCAMALCTASNTALLPSRSWRSTNSSTRVSKSTESRLSRAACITPVRIIGSSKWAVSNSRVAFWTRWRRVLNARGLVSGIVYCCRYSGTASQALSGGILLRRKQLISS